MSETPLARLISSKEPKIGIIGLGYVGLPLALAFNEEGFSTKGFDIDPNKINMINSGKTYIKHIPKDIIDKTTNNGLVSTSNFSDELEPLIIFSSLKLAD